MKDSIILLFPVLQLILAVCLVPCLTAQQSPGDNGSNNVISDSAFDAIIASYYNSSPFYSMIDPQELLKEFANKKIVRKRKLRPKKKGEADWGGSNADAPSLKKVRKRIHLRHRTLAPPTTPRTTTSLPVKTLRMRNIPVYEPNQQINEFAERSYDYEIDYFDRNGLGERYDDEEDFGSQPPLSSNPKKEENIYAELEAFIPGRTSDPDAINFKHPSQRMKKKISFSPKEKKPIFTPNYGHPYAEPISRPNPIDSGIYEADFLNPQTGHFDIPKLYQASKYVQKTTEFAPTVPTTTPAPTTTPEATTTPKTPTSTMTTTTKRPTNNKPSSYVKSLQRRYPRVNDYDYQKLPKKEPETPFAHLKAEHREQQPFGNHPGYRDLPTQRRQSPPPRRRFQNSFKESFNAGHKENSPVLEIKEPDFFSAPSGSFGQNLFQTSQYSPSFKTPPSTNSEYRTLRYPTPKPKEPSRNRYNTAYESPKPKYHSPKPSRVTHRAPPPTYSPPQAYNQPKRTPFSRPPQENINDEKERLVIDSKFKEFRHNSEFTGYLDNFENKAAVSYDFNRGFPLLPPPPAMIATTQNFFGFTDVPKLGSKVNYNPPELIYNKMYEGAYPQSRNAGGNLEEEPPILQRYGEPADLEAKRDESSYFNRPNREEVFGRMYQ